MAIIEHANTWYWGKSYINITDDGCGTATLSISTEYDYSEENDKLEGVEEACISGMSVFGPARHKGIGNRLLKVCENKAKALGFDKVYLWADPKSMAYEWYKRHGYEECPVMCFTPSETNTMIVKMEKSLK